MTQNSNLTNTSDRARSEQERKEFAERLWKEEAEQATLAPMSDARLRTRLYASLPRPQTSNPLGVVFRYCEEHLQRPLRLQIISHDNSSYTVRLEIPGTPWAAESTEAREQYAKEHAGVRLLETLNHHLELDEALLQTIQTRRAAFLKQLFHVNKMISSIESQNQSLLDNHVVAIQDHYGPDFLESVLNYTDLCQHMTLLDHALEYISTQMGRDIIHQLLMLGAKSARFHERNAQFVDLPMPSGDMLSVKRCLNPDNWNNAYDQVFINVFLETANPDVLSKGKALLRNLEPQDFHYRIELDALSQFLDNHAVLGMGAPLDIIQNYLVPNPLLKLVRTRIEQNRQSHNTPPLWLEQLAYSRHLNTPPLWLEQLAYSRHLTWSHSATQQQELKEYEEAQQVNAQGAAPLF